MKKLLPQANNLNTVVDVFIFTSTMKNWTLDDVAGFCKFEVRQASYYINACYYLGLLNEDGSLSEDGKNIILEPNSIKDKVFEKVVSDRLISKIFAKLLIEGENNLKRYVIDLLGSEYPDYSLAVIERRASTLIKWCSEIRKYIFSKKEFKK